MIDLQLLRKDPDKVKDLILRKDPSFDTTTFINLEKETRGLASEIEILRNKRNDLSKLNKNDITEKVKSESIELGKKIKEKETELDEKRERFNTITLACPNLPHEDVQPGGKEKNRTVKIVGSKPNFPFTPKNHLQLNEINKWFDFSSTTSMSGTNFALYLPAGTKIIYALTRLMIKNNVKYGFEPVIPPYLVNEQALINSGNLPKFKGDFYEITEDKLCLIPTAEVSITNIHANQILDGTSLPKRYTAWTSCFRREAGGYGAEERGLIRIHQFEKVEIYSICKPDHSNQELDHIVACSQELLHQLELHYQISLLASEDCSFSSAKTYDIEVWLPGQNRFYEVSSCSNCTDFQARRAKIRYKDDSKPHLVHTLNGSSLALPRLMVALMEQCQQEDGSILLPEILQTELDELW